MACGCLRVEGDRDGGRRRIGRCKRRMLERLGFDCCKILDGQD
jgi:hypothetical protein